MKNLKTTLLLACFTILSISCSNDNAEETTPPPSNQNLMTLNKRITYTTFSLYPEASDKRVQYFSNNTIVADTVFNHLNEWTSRYVKTINGNIELTQQLGTNNQIISQQEITYDNQGRIISRRTNFPQNVTTVSFEYNSDNTVTAKAANGLDGTISTIAVFHKNSDGLVYKSVYEDPSATSGTSEGFLQFDGLKPTALFTSTNPTLYNFNYYPNPKPLNLLKTTNQLNNIVLNELNIMYLAISGNFYYKWNNTTTTEGAVTYQTDFNDNNYIKHYKKTRLTNSNNSTTTTESFYYYN